MADKVNITLEADKEDMLLDEEDTQDQQAKGGRARGKTDDAGRKAKGRGFGRDNDREVDDRYSGSQGKFEIIDDENSSGPIRCMHQFYWLWNTF
jgi:hypothetical protein